MDPFFLPIQISSPAERIRYPQKILLMGSCFTEHIGQDLLDMKFNTLQNPNGILFDPLSVAYSLISYLKPDQYQAGDLFFHNELWQSWKHHGLFSDTDQQAVLNKINDSQQAAHSFMKQADWLIITLGSAFAYFLKEQNKTVANCHRTPAAWFTKKLLPVEEMLAVLDEAMHRLFDLNPNLQIVFTISPVRHIRDGVIENNRSKARLIEVAHQLVSKFNRTYYFPAYELVIDVLRDYRFYDKDLVHPNYMATNYVVENFMEHYVHPDARLLAEEIRKLQISRKHRARHPGTEAHRRFLKEQYGKTLELSAKYPFIDFSQEIAYFSEEK
ncbi:MAG TPA: GSCFA domain-containing protein [Puia sp.]